MDEGRDEARKRHFVLFVRVCGCAAGMGRFV